MNARVMSGVLCAAAAVLLLNVAPQPAYPAPLGTAFTYQGQLQQAGSPAGGTCDFEFDLFAASSGGSSLGTQTRSGVTVTDGLFTISDLDFGAAAFSGEDRYLEIRVRCPSGSGSFTLLSPRQKLTATPNALYAAAAGSVPWSGLSAVPSDFSDNTDNDVLGGLPCGPGEIAKRGGAMWLCAEDEDTTYVIGVGLTLTGSSLSINPNTVQYRVGGTCPAGNAIRAIDIDGNVTCELDDNSGGTVTAITAGTGLMGGTITSSGTISVLFGSSANTVAQGDHGHYGHTWTGGSVNNGLTVENTATDGRGILGKGSGAGGVGVRGESANGTGVYGFTPLGTGVYGESSGVNGTGVFGVASTGTDAWGVGGQSSDGTGVYGNSVTGTGVKGIAVAGADGVYGESTQDGGRGVHGMANSGVNAAGVYGESAGGTGVHGFTTDGTNGVYGESTGNNGTGVFGVADTGTNAWGVGGHSADGTGVYGTTTSGTGVYGFTADGTDGVYGESAQDGGHGVSGVANNGVAAHGVHGESTDGKALFGYSSNGIGVYGWSPNGTGVYGTTSSGWAGYFQGNVHVTGTLTKGGGGFKIDHPLDPANKYLSHSFVESPDMLNLYNGNVTLDASGEAWVELPEWFEALNKEFRYQLTAIGAPAPTLHVAAEIQNRRFKIAGGQAGLKVSWQVTGVRHDPYAEAHRIPVEEDKLPAERGTYLHPQAYGMPESAELYSPAGDSADGSAS